MDEGTMNLNLNTAGSMKNFHLSRKKKWENLFGDYHKNDDNIINNINSL